MFTGRLYFLARLTFLVICTTFLHTNEAAAAPKSSQPNIIFILADDLGYTDVGALGSKYYETPNIDRLAAQGMLFTNFHQSQNCAPSRAALLSGQYSVRTGVYTVGAIDRFEWRTRSLRPVENVTNLPLDRILLPQALKTAGYATAMFGKWHLGQHGNYMPSKRGFDESLVTMGMHADFQTEPPIDYPRGQYLADFLTDRAIDFIKRHRNGPFFLYLPHFSVHTPLVAKPELVAKFKRKAGVAGQTNPTYAAMIASLDESVGRIMDLLDELKLSQNTILIFTSDNGGVGGYIRDKPKQGRSDITDNAPLRSGKGSLYEGGTRVPFITRWPGHVRAGATCDVPTIHVDIYPTLVEIGGGKMPTSQVFDGTSLLPLFRDSSASLGRDAIFQHFPGYLGAGPGQWRTTPVSLIQSGDWKLMEFLEDQHLELYNLREDIGETRNVAAARPDKVKELHAKLVSWRDAVSAPMPTKYDPSMEQLPRKQGQGKAARGDDSSD